MTHPTHKTRMSDSSHYDEKCVQCGATDNLRDDRLEKPCPADAEGRKILADLTAGDGI